MPPKEVPARPKSKAGASSSKTTSSEPNPRKRKSSPATHNSSGDGPMRKVRFGNKAPANVHAARAIPTQSETAALSDDGELDLQAFLAARQFEIRALEESMALSRSSDRSRAFQKVPRSLRRRTASHNAKRVPKRLRARARKEMKEDNAPTVDRRRRIPKAKGPRTRARLRADTAKRLGILARKKRSRRETARKVKQGQQGPKEAPTSDATNAGGSMGAATAAMATKGIPVESRVARPKIRRNLLNDPFIPRSKFRRRQVHKTWLPTHTWHAKRARMTPPSAPLWRFAIPLTPNERVYRPMHRAQGQRGAIVWDTSYMSTVGLFGREAGVARVLKRLGVGLRMHMHMHMQSQSAGNKADEERRCWGGQGSRWRRGERSWAGMLTREAKDGQRRSICPATVLWSPSDEGTNEAPGIQRRRAIFVRVHPSAFLQVFNEMLKWAKMEKPTVYIEDLRWEIGSIQLSGPASTECLHAILKPYETMTHAKDSHAEIFESLAGLTNPASTPAGALLAFSIQDPRLRFPYGRREPRDDEDSQLKLCETLANWPVGKDPKPHGLFGRDTRLAASRLPSQKSINRRKGATRPGRPIPLTSADPPIPTMLLASHNTSSSKTSSSMSTQGTWTLLAPWQAILPLWHSLVHIPLSSGGNPRFGGLDELRQVAFERGTLCFPFDYPGTDAGAAWEAEIRIKREAEWKRRPKGKRVAWESILLGIGRRGEVGMPWGCAWDEAFGQSPAPAPAAASAPGATGRAISRDSGGDNMEVDVDVAVTAPGIALDSLNNLSVRSFNAILSALTPVVPAHAIITVRLAFPSRGVANPCARIYRLPAPSPPDAAQQNPTQVPKPQLPHDLRAQWLSQLPPNHPAYPSSLSRAIAANASMPVFPKNADVYARKKMLDKFLTSTPPTSMAPVSASQTAEINGSHPVVPDAADLMGFVLAGSYCLADGKGVALGCLVVEKVLGTWGRGREGARERLEESICVVRNVGESVGRVAVWSPV